MIDGSEKRNGWLNFKLQSPHVIERRSNVFRGFFGGLKMAQVGYNWKGTVAPVLIE